MLTKVQPSAVSIVLGNLRFLLNSSGDTSIHLLQHAGKVGPVDFCNLGVDGQTPNIVYCEADFLGKLVDVFTELLDLARQRPHKVTAPLRIRVVGTEDRPLKKQPRL